MVDVLTNLSARSAATLAQPTRKSFEGIRKSIDTATASLLDDVQTVPVASSGSEVSSIPHSVSAASLAESDLALLLGTSDQTGSTPLVFGSFPPVSVAVPADDGATAASHVDAALEDASSSGSAAAVGPTKLKADSHEFYPQAYLAAAAATALAARTISTVALSSSNRPSSDSTVQPAQDTTPAAAVVDVECEQAAPSESTAATEPAAVAPEPTYMSAEQQQPQQADQQQQQQVWAVQQWQQQQPGAEQQWQQQHWQHWQAQQQQAAMMGGVHVMIPVFVQPYPYPHYMQQQPQVHYMMVPAAADPAAAANHQQAQHMQQQVPMQVQSLPQQQHMQVACPPSPGGYSLPADTCSLMSAATPAATPTAWQQHSGPYSSRPPSSSAGSVVSAFSSSSTTRRHRQQYGDQASRESGTVTVSAMSCVKDAAGALAKVVTRHGNAMLLSLVKPGDAVAQATHVAAKSLAVARFYVNAHMAAAGAAGIDAAAALTGMDSQHPSQAFAAAGSSTPTAAADDEVVFMPYQRSSSSASSSSRAGVGMDGADVPLGFMVAKTNARDLPVLLPPPVGIPACMQDKVQQQQGAAVAGGGSNSVSSATLLKAGANTDVNKLSNAVIHNILGRWVHVSGWVRGASQLRWCVDHGSVWQLRKCGVAAVAAQRNPIVQCCGCA